jgi:uncharacterized membrane protein YqhA
MTRFLIACRYILVIPIVGCVLLTIGVVIMGMGRIVTSAVKLVQVGDFSAKVAKTMAVAVIEIIDLFLIGTVAYITALGLYRLFISKTDVELPMRLKIDNLQDLEDKIIGVVVVVLAVAFLGHAAGGDAPIALLRYGGGVAVVIAALAFFMRYTGKSSGQ